MITGLLYDCDRSKLGVSLGERFVPIAPDDETDAWIQRWSSQPYGYFASGLNNLLSSFVTTYDAHGLLGGYPMHLLSRLQWQDVLAGHSYESLLDVGAGAGYVAEGARPYFEEIVCTETATQLRKHLAERGFQVSELDLTNASLGRRFDVVACFNVLDRTARPLSLLRSLNGHLEPHGRLLLSVPLPVRAHVHIKGGTVAPAERLPSLSPDWETAARELSERLLEPAGLRVERLLRAPYLSRGDRKERLYVLDAALWVCSRA